MTEGKTHISLSPDEEEEEEEEEEVFIVACPIRRSGWALSVWPWATASFPASETA